jgi:hypothetical protein
VSSEVASAFVSLIPSAKGFAGGISREIGGDLDKAGQDGGRKLGGGVKSGFGKVSGSIKTLVGGAIGGFVAVGLAKVAGFAKGAVDAFAAVEDATGAAGVQFGKALPQVLGFADKAATSFGLSKRAALDAQNTFGTLGKSAGLQGPALADFAGKFSGLAGDLASFKGTSTEQAIAAVGAALRGETEPIRAYGVLLDDASLRQEALAQGLIKTTKEALTPQQKVLATQALLFKQTTDAQGDFARTSDSTANTQKRLQAATENAQAALGQKLAPAVTALRAGFLNLIQGTTTLIDFIGRISAAAQPVIDAFIAGIGPAVVAAKDAFLGFIAAIPVPILLAIGAGVAVIGTAMAAMAIASGIASAATSAFAAVQGALNAVLALNPIVLVVAALAALVVGLVYAYKHSETFRDIVDGAFTKVKAAGAALATFFTTTIPAAFQSVKDRAVAIVSGIRDFLAASWAAIKGGVTAAFDGVKLYFTTVFNIYKTIITTAFNAIKDVITRVLGTIQTVVRTALTAVTGIFTTAFNGAKAVVGSVMSAISSNLSAVLNGAKAIVSGILTAIVGLFTGNFGKAKAGAVTAINGLVSFLRGLGGMITGAIGNLGALLVNAGKQLISGLISGITSKLSALRDKMSSVASTVKGFLPGSPVKEGPLTSWNRGAAGVRLMDLLVSGIVRGRASVGRALNDSLDVARMNLGDANYTLNRLGVSPVVSIPTVTVPPTSQDLRPGGVTYRDCTIYTVDPDEWARKQVDRQRDAAVVHALAGITS